MVCDYYSNLEESLRDIFFFNIVFIVPVVLFVYFMVGEKLSLKKIIKNLFKIVWTWWEYVAVTFAYYVVMLIIGFDPIELGDPEYYSIKYGLIYEFPRLLILYYSYIYLFIDKLNIDSNKKSSLIILFLKITIILIIIVCILNFYFINCKM